jgi:hypothetical protein
MNRIVSLMGHGEKGQVNRRYGFYLDGLEDDRPDITDFFGEDFVKSNGAIEQPLRKTRRKKFSQYQEDRKDDI